MRIGKIESRAREVVYFSKPGRIADVGIFGWSCN